METEPTAEFLARNDCDSIQGYLVSQPLAAEDFSPFLENMG